MEAESKCETYPQNHLSTSCHVEDRIPDPQPISYIDESNFTYKNVLLYPPASVEESDLRDAALMPTSGVDLSDGVVHVHTVNRERCQSAWDNRSRVLVVDDAGTNRKMLCRSLRGLFDDIQEAEDGLEAIEKVKLAIKEKFSYNAILMDFFMPNMDGPAATYIIRNELKFSGKIIGITGNAIASDIEHFMQKGADKVLIKPVDVNEIRSCLR